MRVNTVASEMVSCLLFWMVCYQPGINRVAVWTWLVERFHSLYDFEIWMYASIFHTVTWSSVAICYALYSLQIPWIERHRTSSGPWPWNHANAKTQAHYGRVHRQAVIQFVIVYIVLGIPITAIVGLDKWSMRLDNALVDSRLRYVSPLTIPSQSTIVLHVAMALVVSSALVYWRHRLLHRPWWYAFHKRHHEFHHVSILAANYNHPVEMVFVAAETGITMNVMTYAFDTHAYALSLWFVLVTIGNAIDHCGYNVHFWVMPLGMGSSHAKFHDIHHRQLTCNFANTPIWDIVFATARYS